MHVRRIPLQWTTVYSDDTTVQRVLAASPWMPAGALTGARGVMELRERVGDIKVGIGIEVANVANAPLATAEVEPMTASTGVHFGDSFTALATTTQGRQLVRFVWLTQNATVNELAFARVGGYVEIEERC
jgi:hypothetical protein